MLRRLWRKMRALLFRDRMEREMERELRFHLEQETASNLGRGMSEEEARRAALISFGGVERCKEECRDERRPRRLETLWQDVGYGARILRRNPGYATLAVLTLALGIGANSAVFSIVYGVLLRPLPYENGDQLVALRQPAIRAGVSDARFSVREIEDYRAQNRTLAGIVEHHSMTFTLFGGAEPELIQTGVVSANYFEVMGVRPLMGRTFQPADEGHGAEAVLILSYGYWERSHHRDPAIVGKVFRMNDRPHTIIGVLPNLPQYPNENDVYMPTSACPTRSSAGFISNREARMMSAFARLRPGVPIAQAQADLHAIAERMHQDHRAIYTENRGYRTEALSLREELTRQARPTFFLLFCTAGLVLLIACANVANLMLARLMRREREMALRAALGASRGRLIRQMLTESALLSLLGGLFGLMLAAWGREALVGFAARFTPRAHEIGLDGPVLLTTLIGSILAGLLFGLIPALSLKEELFTSIKQKGKAGNGQSATGAGWRSGLVVAQVAVSFMLLIGAGLMVRSLIKLQQVDPGFDPEKVLTMRVSPNWSKYTSNAAYQDFSLRLIDKIRAQPGVLSAAMASIYPLSPRGNAQGPFTNDFQIEGRPLAAGAALPRADRRIVSPDYFLTIRLPLVSGRLLSETDNEQAPKAAVINQTMARHHWNSEDPIGKRISFDRGATWAIIVGVVGDVRQYGLDRDAADEIYSPIRQFGGGGNLLVRTAADPMSLLRQVRKTVYDVDPETAIDDVRTLEEARRNSLASPRLTTILLGIFAALALVITGAGIAGVTALSVSQRTHEIGIRLALGASRGAVIWMVLRQGMRLILLGLAAGSLGAIALARWMSSLLFALEPTDPLTFCVVAIVLLLAAALACLIPARRVTSIDPMTALRTE